MEGLSALEKTRLTQITHHQSFSFPDDLLTACVSGTWANKHRTGSTQLVSLLCLSHIEHQVRHLLLLLWGVGNTSIFSDKSTERECQFNTVTCLIFSQFRYIFFLTLTKTNQTIYFCGAPHYHIPRISTAPPLNVSALPISKHS